MVVSAERASAVTDWTSDVTRSRLVWSLASPRSRSTACAASRHGAPADEVARHALGLTMQDFGISKCQIYVRRLAASWR